MAYMKRVRNVLLFIVVVCLVALPNLLFVGCSSDSGKSNLPEYIQEWRLGGALIAGEEGQLFAKYSVDNSRTEEPFKGKIEVEPDGLEIKIDTLETVQENYINFYVSPKETQTGKYKYRITIFSLNELYEVDGEIAIGEPFEGKDKLQGGANRSRSLREAETKDFILLRTTSLGKQSISNVAPFQGNIVVGTSVGSLYFISNTGEIQGESQTSDNAIEFVQTTDDIIIVATVDGEILTFEPISDDDTFNLKQLSSTNIDSRLSGLPTLVDEKSMVVCTVDGYMRMLSLPNLDTAWEHKAMGSFNGGACVLQMKTGDDTKSVIVASSDDRAVYYLDENGILLDKEQGRQLVSCTPAANKTKLTLTTVNNQVYARTLHGTTLWGNQMHYEVVSGPAFNGKFVAVSSEKMTQIFDIDDGIEQVSINLDDSVAGESFFLGDNICVPTADGVIAIYDAYTGNLLDKLHFNGELKYTPLILEGGTIVGINDNSQIFFWGIPTKVENMGELDPESIVYNGGRGGPKHPNYIGIDLPIHQRRLLTIQGRFAPALVSNKYLFLYNIDEERFSCRLRDGGAEVWGFNAEAPYKDQFFGAGVDLGFHNSPLYYTPEGLILSTVDGLVLVDPLTGNQIKQTKITGICNADNEVIIVANLEKLYCLEKNNFQPMWEIDGSFYAESVCIDGNTVYAVDRREGNAKIHVIEKMTGKITFTAEDETLAFASKLVVTDKYVGFGSFGGVWLFHKNPPSAVGAIYGTNRSANLIVKDNEIITTNQIGDITKLDVDSFKETPIQPPSSPDAEINWMYFDGNEIMTSNALVQLAKYLPKVPEGQKATEAQNQEVIDNTHLMIRDPGNGKPLFTELIDSSGASEFSLTIGADVVAVCVHNGLEPKLILFGK